MKRGRIKKGQHQERYKATKQLIADMIEYIKEGYPITGDNSALNKAIQDNDFSLSLCACYSWMYRNDKQLYQDYKQSVENSKQIRRSNRFKNGNENRENLLKEIIGLIHVGYKPIGTPNAVKHACRNLNIKEYHWATIHKWLREDFKHLKDDYNAAMKAKKGGFASN